MKTVKQKLNMSLTLPQNNVKIHKVMLDMPYPLFVRSEQECMIDEQLRKKICEQEEKKRTQQTRDIQIAKPKRMKLKCTDNNEKQNMQSNAIIEIEKEVLISGKID
jgi:histone acetyltransferase (RNA polymerase elongator complex component)